jgi:diaminopimelate decarboxylase
MGYAHLAARGESDPRWIGKSYWTAFPASRMLAHILEHRFEDGTTVVDRLAALGRPRLIVEPGRSLMATAGVTLALATGVKTVAGHPVVSLDMGINNHGTNLISPDIFPAAVLPKQPDDRPVDAFLAGRLCFSGDMISKVKVQLNRLPTSGERCVVYHTGAYSADHFASNSCGFPLPAKAAIRPDGTAELWRAPQTFTDVFGAPGDELPIADRPDA